MTLYMVIEHVRNGDAAPVYRRFRERGRMELEDLAYTSSWVSEGLSTCYQVMETTNLSLLEERMLNWVDPVEFEVRPVLTS